MSKRADNGALSLESVTADDLTVTGSLSGAGVPVSHEEFFYLNNNFTAGGYANHHVIVMAMKRGTAVHVTVDIQRSDGGVGVFFESNIYAPIVWATLPASLRPTANVRVPMTASNHNKAISSSTYTNVCMLLQTDGTLTMGSLYHTGSYGAQSNMHRAQAHLVYFTDTATRYDSDGIS